MEIIVSFEEVQGRHPEEVKRIIKALRAGKSKEKNAAPEELIWYYFWGVQVKALSFNEMIERVMEPKVVEEKKALTVHEELKVIAKRIDEIVPNIKFCLGAKLRRWAKTIETIDDVVPPEIKEYYRKAFAEDEAKKACIAEFTGKERNAKVEEALKELRKSSGFIEIKGR